MNHEEAVQYVIQENGPFWGGYASDAPKVLEEWVTALRQGYEANRRFVADVILDAEGRRGNSPRWPADHPYSWTRLVELCMPSDSKYVRAGLHDTEGYIAAFDYILARTSPVDMRV